VETWRGGRLTPPVDYAMRPQGDVAEWLRSGLQSRVHRFDSGRRLYRLARVLDPDREPPRLAARVLPAAFLDLVANLVALAGMRLAVAEPLDLPDLRLADLALVAVAVLVALPRDVPLPASSAEVRCSAGPAISATRTSSWTTSNANSGIRSPRYDDMRSSSRRMSRASLAVSLSPTALATLPSVW
jgi:hypothetical protein